VGEVWSRGPRRARRIAALSAPDEPANPGDDAARRLRAARLTRLRAESDARDARPRLPVLNTPLDKYRIAPDELPDIPCAELLPLCRARCCSFRFALSQQDLDEGVARWDATEPYLILHSAQGTCTHLDVSAGCSIYAQRPRPCRVFDCREDRRIWRDFALHIPAQ
jgi:Fe-S-cluster containining protein